MLPYQVVVGNAGVLTGRRRRGDRGGRGRRGGRCCRSRGGLEQHRGVRRAGSGQRAKQRAAGQLLERLLGRVYPRAAIYVAGGRGDSLDEVDASVLVLHHDLPVSQARHLQSATPVLDIQTEQQQNRHVPAARGALIKQTPEPRRAGRRRPGRHGLELRGSRAAAALAAAGVAPARSPPA